MELPIVTSAPVVTDHAGVFRDLFDHQCPVRHVQHDLTGLIVLPHKSLANITRGILESADHTNLSRVLSEAPWRKDEVNRRRLQFMRQQTTPHRQRRRESVVALDETLCEHGGRLFDDVDRHDHPQRWPLSPGPSPGHQRVCSGPVRFPLGLRLYRRAEALTPWEAAVATHVPDVTIPRETKARHRLHQQVDPVLLEDPECRARHEPCQTTIALAMELVEEAIRCKVPCGGVVCDAWDVAEELVQVLARRRKHGISLLNKNRGLETASVQLRDAHGWTLQRPGPHSAVEDLVPLIPAQAYRPVSVRGHTSWCFTRGVRIPGMGKVRIVVSCEHEALTGRSVVLVSNRVDWSAATIIGLYLQRWPTQTCDQDRQGPWGFNAYLMRSTEALGNHGCLVFVAYALRHLTCLPAVSDRTQGLIQSLGDACRQQGRALLQRLLVFVHDQLSRGVTVDHGFAQVCAKQRGMVPV